MWLRDQYHRFMESCGDSGLSGSRWTGGANRTWGEWFSSCLPRRCPYCGGTVGDDRDHLLPTSLAQPRPASARTPLNEEIVTAYSSSSVTKARISALWADPFANFPGTPSGSTSEFVAGSYQACFGHPRIDRFRQEQLLREAAGLDRVDAYSGNGQRTHSDAHYGDEDLQTRWHNQQPTETTGSAIKIRRPWDPYFNHTRTTARSWHNAPPPAPFVPSSASGGFQSVITSNPYAAATASPPPASLAPEQLAGSSSGPTLNDSQVDPNRSPLLANEIWLILLTGETVRATFDQRGVVYQGHVYNDEEIMYLPDEITCRQIDPAAPKRRVTRGPPINANVTDDGSIRASSSGRCTCCQRFMDKANSLKEKIASLGGPIRALGATALDAGKEWARTEANSIYPTLRNYFAHVLSLLLTVTMWTSAVFKEAEWWGIVFVMVIFSTVYSLLQMGLTWTQRYFTPESYDAVGEDMGTRNVAKQKTWPEIAYGHFGGVVSTAVFVAAFLTQPPPEGQDTLNLLLRSTGTALISVYANQLTAWLIARVGPNPRPVSGPVAGIAAIALWLKSGCCRGLPPEAKKLLGVDYDPNNPPSTSYWAEVLDWWNTSWLVMLLFAIGFTDDNIFKQWLERDVYKDDTGLREDYKNTYFLWATSAAASFIWAVFIVRMKRKFAGWLNRRRDPAQASLLGQSRYQDYGALEGGLSGPVVFAPPGASGSSVARSPAATYDEVYTVNFSLAELTATSEALNRLPRQLETLKSTIHGYVTQKVDNANVDLTRNEIDWLQAIIPRQGNADLLRKFRSALLAMPTRARSTSAASQEIITPKARRPGAQAKNVTFTQAEVVQLHIILQAQVPYEELRIANKLLSIFETVQISNGSADILLTTTQIAYLKQRLESGDSVSPVLIGKLTRAESQ